MKFVMQRKCQYKESTEYEKKKGIQKKMRMIIHMMNMLIVMNLMMR